MKTIVTKFGGSSLADAAHIKNAAAILKAEPARRFVVVSAPGKRNAGDIKVTDLLYQAYRLKAENEDFMPVLKTIEDRFADILKELDVSFDIHAEIRKIAGELEKSSTPDYIASRGEYLNGRVIAEFLGWDFLDPKDFICFSENGSLLEEETNDRFGSALASSEYAVIPGFYGAFPDGRICTFSRGGSDITGSLAARAISADLYENWTDVSGMLFTDPRIVENPRTVPYITYQELRELSYMGASVLHEDAVFPVRKAGISINIRNTNKPEDAGTMIVKDLPAGYAPGAITGTAGRKGFAAIHVEKSNMNTAVGFGAHLLKIIADEGISMEHCPTGIDTFAVVLSESQLLEKQENIVRRIREELTPDSISIDYGLAIIAVVGIGMLSHKGIAARVFRAVADANVNVDMIDSGAGGMNIIMSVKECDYETTIRAIYEEFKEG